MTMNGTLEDFSPAGILKVLADDGRTGAARFAGPAECTVYLHRGQLYFARSASTDEALATALVRPGRLTADAWGQAIEASEDRPLVGELLVRHGAIAPDLLASVVLSVIYDPLIELFRDGSGEFDFETDTVHWLGPFRAFPVDAIVGEVRKRSREVDEWSDTIPGLDASVEANRTLPGTAAQVTLLREDWELVTALTGPRSIDELAGELGRGRYSTARVVHRLQEAGLIRVLADTTEADVVQLHRPSVDDQLVADDLARDPLLDRGLPHRTVTGARLHDVPDPLTAHIGEAIAGALSDANHVPVASGPNLSIAPPMADEADEADEADTEAPSPTLPTRVLDPGAGSWSAAATGDDTAAVVENDDDIWTHDDDESVLAEAQRMFPPEGGDASLGNDSWDESRRIADGNALHHDGQEATSLDEPRPKDPNAAWLADLYAQFIDDPETNSPKKRRRGEPNPVDVAFKASEQEGEEKVSTLKRLLGALKKL